MSVHEMIQEMPPFKNFSDKEKKAFARMNLPVRKFKKGDVIIKEGDLSTNLYLLIQGGCLITKSQDGAHIRLSKLGPGEIFGEMSWVSGKPRQSNVIANESVLVMKMDDGFFNALSPELSNKIKDYLIELLIRRLDRMNDAIMRISKLMRS